MRISFVTPHAGHSGGIRVIATYAEPTLSSLPVVTRGTVIRLFGLVVEPLLGLLDSEMIANSK